MRIITEAEFAARLRERVASDARLVSVDWVTGPGRSGAIAAVYASHLLGVPFIPYGQPAPARGRILVIDTATESGATLRKAERRYAEYRPVLLALFHEPPRVAFWYEAQKPQRYRHERSRNQRPQLANDLPQPGEPADLLANERHLLDLFPEGF